MTHVHKLIKKKLNPTYAVFKCILPDCHFYINAMLIEGRRAICWRCGEAFILTKVEADQVKPHCRECTHKRSVLNQ